MRSLALALLVATPTIGARELLTSPCVGTRRPGGAARLATVHLGAASWTQARVASFDLPEPDEPAVVCLPAAAVEGERRQVVAIGGGAAVFAFVEPSALTETKLDDPAWKQFRFGNAEGGQTGCLRKFAVGTPLYDSPAGRVVGVLIDRATPWGKWGEAKLAGASWAKLRLNIGLGPMELWLKDTPGDWCPL